MKTFPIPLLLPIICILSMCTLCISCSPAEQATKPASLVIRKIEQTKGNCEQPEGACFKVVIQMPQYEGTLDDFQETFNQTIQDEVNQYLTDFMDPEFKSTSIEATLEALYKDFSGYVEEMEAMQIPVPQSWSFEIDGSAYYNHDRIVTVQFNIYSYTGGAHPNGYTAFINIAEDGTMPEITEIITDTTAVKAMI
ncbi:DUF4163 domain-containing protein [Limnospira sp. PMC 1280.21]|uniref:DUF4163 domain-containing protein n=1 Tax=Limnospira sp. PMC 1280.21 TaxID=2981063 RepID=UPI0028EA3AE5|nr:DUF4163 domain-containing protein [Limnospira sp. PMC 1280.21]